MTYTQNCHNCAAVGSGFEYNLTTDVCFTGVTCNAATGWEGTVYGCDNYDYYPLGDSFRQEAEVNPAYCKGTCSGIGCCEVMLGTCSTGYECRYWNRLSAFLDETSNPDVLCYRTNAGKWVWDVMPSGYKETNCTDGLDNDCDGLIDGCDPDCAEGSGTMSATLSERCCNDGIDNDGDGYMDANDQGCCDACTAAGNIWNLTDTATNARGQACAKNDFIWAVSLRTPNNQYCCGNNPGESYSTQIVARHPGIDNIENYPNDGAFLNDTKDAACLADSNQCIYNSTLYLPGKHSELPIFGDETVCQSGKWVDCDYNLAACTTCGDIWVAEGENKTFGEYELAATSTQTECCSDDSGEYYITRGIGRGCCASNAANICVDEQGICQTEYGQPESKCSDGVDNDCDGRIDCEDPDCYGKIDSHGDRCCLAPGDIYDSSICTLSELCTKSKSARQVPRGVCDSLCRGTTSAEVTGIKNFITSGYLTVPPYVYNQIADASGLASDVHNYDLSNDCSDKPHLCYPRCILKGYDPLLDCVPHGCFANCDITTNNASQYVVAPGCFP